MIEFTPEVRSEVLIDHLDEPILGVFDQGLEIQNPMRRIDDDFNKDYIHYRKYAAVAIPQLVDSPLDFEQQRDRLLPTGMSYISIGNAFYSDLWDKYPSYLYSSGHIIETRPIRQGEFRFADAEILTDAEVAGSHSGHVMDAILREQTLASTLIIGNQAIAAFLEGYIDETESAAKKAMPSRETEYLLPRVDWDVLSMIVSARIAGLPLDQVEIPEEHRYRVLLNTANVLAHYYTESKFDYDISRSTRQDYEDESRWKLELELSRPLHSVLSYLHENFHTFFQTGYDPSIACLLYAYDFKLEELVETTQQMWFGREYWNGLATTTPHGGNLRTHYDQPPDAAEHAKRFLENVSKEDAQYYAELVRATIITAADPYRQLVDKSFDR